MSSSNAMFFTDENTVVMAWLLNVEQGGTKAFQNQDGIDCLARILPTQPTLTFGVMRMSRASQHNPNGINSPQSGFQLQAPGCIAGLAKW